MPASEVAAKSLVRGATSCRLRALGVIRTPHTPSSSPVEALWYRLRHAFATLRLVSGSRPLWVLRQLRHGSVKTTADTHGAWIQPESPRAANAFAERIARFNS
jgi:hypothetical protein